MKNLLKYFLAIPLFLSGCVATQHDMLQMQSQMDDLNSSLSNMQKNQADLAVKMDNLSRNLNAFSESLKEVSDRMEKFGGNLSKMNTNINSKVSNLGQKIAKQQREVKEDLLPAKIYANGYSSMVNNNYDSAIYYFKKYISKSPKGEMIEGAYYNLGKAYYSKKNWKDAAISYANLLDKYPQSFRVPSARLHYAKSLLNMPGKKTVEALKYLKSVIKDFPDSPEAKKAAEEIKKLSKKPSRRHSKKSKRKR